VRHIVALLTALTTMLSALAIGCGGAFAQDGMADVSVAGAPDVLALRTTPQDVLIAGDNNTACEDQVSRHLSVVPSTSDSLFSWGKCQKAGRYVFPPLSSTSTFTGAIPSAINLVVTGDACIEATYLRSTRTFKA
jgi:hypothetical protein